MIRCGGILTVPPKASERTPLPNALPFGKGEGERPECGTGKMRPMRGSKRLGRGRQN